MILKKSLRRRQKKGQAPRRCSGQATFEYFLIFTAVLMLGFLSVSTFFPKVRNAVQGSPTGPGYAQKAFNAIISADLRW